MSIPEAPPAERPLDVRLVVAAAACWLVVALGILVGSGFATALAVAGGAGALLALAAHRHGGRREWLIAAALLLACTGFSVSTALRAGAADAVEGLLAGTSGRAVLVVSDDPRPIAGGSFDGRPRVLVRGRLEVVRRGGADVAANGSVLVFAPAQGWESLLPGQRVVFRGRFASPLREDLSVATVRVDAAPEEVGEPSWLQRGAGGIRARFAELSGHVLARRKRACCPGWCSAMCRPSLSR